jgi:hypothetical protein
MGGVFYNYVIFRENGEPFYVGKGKDERVFDHEKEARRPARSGENRIKLGIMRRMLAAGFDIPIVFIREGISEPEAFETEAELIKVLGRIDLGTGCLANLTDGGEGNSGYRFTEEQRKKVSVANKGNSRLSYPKSAETRAKLAIAHIGLKPSVETRIKLSRAQTGQAFHQDPAYRAKLSKTSRGRMMSESARAKMRLAWKCRKAAEGYQERQNAAALKAAATKKLDPAFSEKQGAVSRAGWEKWRTDPVHRAQRSAALSRGTERRSKDPAYIEKMRLAGVKSGLARRAKAALQEVSIDGQSYGEAAD